MYPKGRGDARRRKGRQKEQQLEQVACNCVYWGVEEDEKADAARASCKRAARRQPSTQCTVAVARTRIAHPQRQSSVPTRQMQVPEQPSQCSE